MAEEMHRRVLSDQVREHLLEGIFNGTYPPASRVVETAVARELGVSQAPVREALRALEAVGLIRIEPHRGARVNVPSPREIIDSNLVRESLEALAISTAPAESLVSDELREAHALMLDRAAAEDARGFSEADVAFHAALVAMPANATLTRMWRSLEPTTRTYMTAFIADLQLDWLAKLHTPIFSALESGSIGAAREALRTHFAEINHGVSTAKLDTPHRLP